MKNMISKKSKTAKKSEKSCSLMSILGKDSCLKNRCILNLDLLKEFVDHCKGLGIKIVLTQGSYDMIHIGHARYFEAAKSHGDLLIVGLDSDEKIRRRKGPDRPIVPQNERLEMLTHIRSVDVITIKEYDAPKWHLSKLIEPDVLIATQENYTKEEIKELEKFCGKVTVLEPQATTSTSAKVRRMQIATAKKLGKALTPRLIKAVQETFNEIGNK